jgi:heme/copper-type cytochrome/quinol oxidase subunit 4
LVTPISHNAADVLRHGQAGGVKMRYVVAWLLGVPLSVIAIWFVVGHAACGH